MPRKIRVEYPDAVYHVMSRGNRRASIFLDDVDRQDFLKTLAEACQKTGWQVHASCLMDNHFHLVVETPNANLVAGMRWLLSTYSIRLNNRHKLFGHVFSGRYKALVVDGSGNGYLKTVCDYVHLNPVRARLLKPEERLLGYPWSSLGWYAAAREHRPFWMRVDRLLGEHGVGRDTAANRQEFERRMEARRTQEDDEDSIGRIRRGGCFGGPEFKREVLERMEGRLGENHSGEIRRESAEVRAGRIIEEEMRRLRWTREDWEHRRKGDPDRLMIAARLRRETTLTIREIAQRMKMGTSQAANSNLHRWMQNSDKAPEKQVREGKAKTRRKKQEMNISRL